ncbi:MAG: hypothetical protein AAGH76_16485 [Pseudomonadota bacterium]
MPTGSSQARQRVGFLLFELVVIVLGVLIALAVDEWRDDREFAKRELHILKSLAVDLAEDAHDFTNFVENAQARELAADYLIGVTADPVITVTGWDKGPGEALFELAITSRLQPSRSAFDELKTTGAGLAISDRELVSYIGRYYSTAIDRLYINALIAPEIQRFRGALEELGISYADKDDAAAVRAMANPKVRAIVRSIGDVAGFAPDYVVDLLEYHESLVERVTTEIDRRQ